ncbi:MAG: hypothetical protein RMM10_11265 [Anaerolineae bacterium]|uniref:hypothetical protein n=1 Tax=Thermoflexus sp. TaxID=1969742 RepID=UPI0025FE2646|nr:hypothetical protein [Thermoflexus sp.]MCS7352079.1 hypothetical protein [Thermoflexus sp.]MDW8181538.1 hypothetical protein [Anaerolineae bacterium]
MLKGIWREFYEYLTYDDYGRRRPRPAVYRLLAAVGVALGLGAGTALFACQAPPAAPQPVPTSTPPTATATVARIATATASAPPTPTPEPPCPEDPRLWQLVEVKPYLDPGTGNPVQRLKPIYRIEPACVYAGFWRDAAHILFLTDPPKPTVEKRVENVPWYWSPDPGFMLRPFRPILNTIQAVTFYDREGSLIDEVLTIYTVVQTGDPDYPVMLYLYRDYPEAAYGVQWENGLITEVRPVSLEGGTVLRRVGQILYDARGRRWVYADIIPGIGGYPRGMHATDADGSALWEILGVRGLKRSELAKVFGMREFFPERINLKEWKLGKIFRIGP